MVKSDMSKLKNKIFITTVLLFIFSFSYSLTLTEEKINLEKSIQNRTEEIIQKILGNKNFVVLVNIDIKTPEQTPASNIDLSQQQIYPGAYIREEEYLPGVTYSYLPVTNPATNLPMQLVIDKIVINIAVDVTTKDEIINRIKTEIPALLGLNLARGDIINVTKIKFQTVPTWQMILEQLLPHLYIPLIVLILAIFLFGPVTFLFRTIVQAVQLRIESDTRLRATEKTEVSGQTQTGLLPGVEPLGLPAAGGPSGTMELTVGGKKEEKTPRKHFDFVNKSNLKNLWYLVKDESPSVIALILSYLPSDLVAEFMSMLDNRTQAKVALELASVKMPDPQEVKEIEENIKSRIDYCIGGEDYFLSLLDRADKEVQQDILQTLSVQDPVLAEKLRQKIFLFEDILFLDKTTLQKILRETQRRGISLAIMLKGAPEEIKNKVMDCLTEGGRAMLAEQIDLLGEIGEKVIKDEQKKLVSVVRDLINSGEINIDRSKFVKEQIEKQKSMTIEPEVVEEKNK
jgi:flagellar motor switch protein FliG